MVETDHCAELTLSFRHTGKLKTVISGHLGWVRSVAVEPGNQWFATGAGDRVIKVSPAIDSIKLSKRSCVSNLPLTAHHTQIWDLASSELKLSLTGHISPVRGLAVSNRHPYLFSCGEDKVSLNRLVADISTR